MIRWHLATDEQLWAVMEWEKGCPLPLLKECFEEAVKRGMIRMRVLLAVKKVFKHLKFAQKQLKMEVEDILQLGYEAAWKALEGHKTNEHALDKIMFIHIKQHLLMQWEKWTAKKRRGEEVTIDKLQYYMEDQRSNVEQAVVNKLMLESQLSLLTEDEKKTVLLTMKGYTSREIAKFMGVANGTPPSRLKKAFIKMTGEPVNITKLGTFERVTYKRGAGA